jgi:serine/threonine-protein kinase
MIPRETCGPIRIHERFAAGGMAAVHFGWSTSTRTVVAVKCLYPHLRGDATLTNTLVRDVRAAMALRHPNVVPVLGVVVGGEDLLVGMEYVPGASLAEILGACGSRGLAPRYATAIVASALRGLHAAHAAGLVHRCLSPEKILVGDEGVTRVLGFGLGGAEARFRGTYEPIVRWKLAHVAPEQLTGETADARSDVYSVSAILWEALTGRSLFQAPTIDATLHRILSEPAPRLGAIPAVLEAIVLRGLARNPDARWSDAREMALALEGACPIESPREVAQHVRSLRVRASAARRRAAEIVLQRELAREGVVFEQDKFAFERGARSAR